VVFTGIDVEDVVVDERGVIPRVKTIAALVERSPPSGILK